MGLWGPYWLASICGVAAPWSLIRRPALSPGVSVAAGIFLGLNAAFEPWLLSDPTALFQALPILGGPAALLGNVLLLTIGGQVIAWIYVLLMAALYGLYAYLIFVVKLQSRARIVLIVIHALCAILAMPVGFFVMFSGPS